MGPKIDQGTIILLDVGRNVANTNDKIKQSFFGEAKKCAGRIIERKILSQGKNLIGVILIGSKKTKNNMALQCDGAFKHVEVLSELQEPTWQMIIDLPDAPSKCKANWFDGIIVAADMFKNTDCKITDKKIILMSNIVTPCEIESNDIEVALQGLKEDNLEIDVFGPDLYQENNKNEDMSILRQFVEETNGTNVTFEFAMRYFLFHKKKSVNATPWNADLIIGPDLKIPISSYIRIKDEPAIKNWKVHVKDPVSSTASCSEGIVKEKLFVDAEKQTVIDSDNIIKGYQYGQRVIPFSECDKTMLYESGDKGLVLYGFTDASNIGWQNLVGDGLSYVFGRKGDSKAQNTIKCLVQCLHELNLVAIVRRVYNRGNAPKMFVLMPVIDTNDFMCLSMVNICYKEDIKNLAFPPTNLPKYSCSEEQVNAFKDLISSMDLMQAYDDTFDDAEAFPTAETVSPSVQYILDCIAYRAMNPGKPLQQPRDEIMMLFKSPPIIAKKAKDPLEKLKKLFVLQKVETKNIRKRPKANEDEFDLDIVVENKDFLKITLPLNKKPKDLDHIGTVDPVSDFKALLEEGRPIKELFKEILETIECLFQFNIGGTCAKAFNTMVFLREYCIQNDPSPYNDWMKVFKQNLADRNKLELISKINEKDLSFITHDENASSKYTAESEDSQLYENNTIPNTTELTIDSEVNDLFDEM